ncbi:MAG: hypothetical protein WA635_10595, partial [Gallionella sp.]
MVDAASLNADATAGRIDRVALDAAIGTLGAQFQDAISIGHDFLFADAALFITPAQMEQMRDVVAAAERVVKLPGWMEDARSGQYYLGVFYGYDFHLNDDGTRLIEINTNAGGAFLNALLAASQRDVAMPGIAVSPDGPEQSFLDMFRNEWVLARGDAPLKAIAIVDEQPESQYLYPEFLLAQCMFRHAGIAAHICDPSVLQIRDKDLYLDKDKIDLVYNRLTDFSLRQHPALFQAYLDGSVVVTPSPAHFVRYADKRNLARLSDAAGLRALGANESDIAVLQAGVPHTFVVQKGADESLWQQRKELFFKPVSGYGSKGVYRGDKLTKRVFGEILQSDYVAQKLATPGERSVCPDDGETTLLKYDVRCFVYDGQIQLVGARLYR